MASHNYTIVFLKRADTQYEEAIEWYKDKSFSAAVGFVKDVYERLTMLQDDPSRYRKTYNQFYEVSLQKYPYILVFKIDDRRKQVSIVSVHHHKQNPKRKYR